MSVRARMYQLLENLYANAGDSSEDEEHKLMAKAVAKRHDKRNPTVAYSSIGKKWSVDFHYISKKFTAPLTWTEEGFKQLETTRVDPVEFDTKEEAEEAVRKTIIPWLKKQKERAHLIVGW